MVRCLSGVVLMASLRFNPEPFMGNGVKGSLTLKGRLGDSLPRSGLVQQLIRQKTFCLSRFLRINLFDKLDCGIYAGFMK